MQTVLFTSGSLVERRVKSSRLLLDIKSFGERRGFGQRLFKVLGCHDGSRDTVVPFERPSLNSSSILFSSVSFAASDCSRAPTPVSVAIRILSSRP